MGVMLGSIHNEQGRQTEITLAMLDEIRELPDKLASKLKAAEAHQVSTLLEIGAKAFEFVKEALPIIAVVLAALAKYLGFDLGLSGH